MIICLLLPNCKHNNNTASKSDNMEYAQWLDIEHYDSYTQVTVRNPWNAGSALQTYCLVPRGNAIPSNANGTIIKVPVQSALVYSSVHGGIIKELGALQSITGVCDAQYFDMPEIKQLVADGRIVDAGNSMQPTIERIVQLRPDAIILSPFQNGGYGALTSLGTPIIECADYMEHSPLARAEWMRFYGMLFGCSAEADSLFAVVEKNYMSFKKIASVMPRHPKLMCDLMQGAAWYVPGGKSTMGQAFKDAGAEYIFGGNNSAGSVPLSFEAVYDRALNADVWVMRCGMAGVTYASLKKEREAYSHFRPWRERRIYSCNTLEVPFFDESPFRPDYLLGDLVKILYPEKCTDYSFRYFSPVK